MSEPELETEVWVVSKSALLAFRVAIPQLQVDLGNHRQQQRVVPHRPLTVPQSEQDRSCRHCQLLRDKGLKFLCLQEKGELVDSGKPASSGLRRAGAADSLKKRPLAQKPLTETIADEVLERRHE